MRPPSLLSPWKLVSCRSCHICSPGSFSPRLTRRAADISHTHHRRSADQRAPPEEAYLFDVADPVPDVVEGLLVGDVVDQHDPLQTGSDISTQHSDEGSHDEARGGGAYHGSSVIGCGDGPEPLLTCCVPETQRSHQAGRLLRQPASPPPRSCCQVLNQLYNNSYNRRRGRHAHHICSLILFPSSSTVRILKSIPEKHTTVELQRF